MNDLLNIMEYGTLLNTQELLEILSKAYKQETTKQEEIDTISAENAHKIAQDARQKQAQLQRLLRQTHTIIIDAAKKGKFNTAIPVAPNDPLIQDVLNQLHQENYTTDSIKDEKNQILYYTVAW